MKKFFFAILFLFGSLLHGQAQLVLPQVLQKPIQQALERNKAIANKQLDVDKVNLERKQVLGKYIPKIDATAGYAYLNNKTTIDLPGFELPVTGTELFSGKTKINNRANFLHGGLMAKSVLFSGMQIQNGAKALEQKAKGDALLIETDKTNLIIDVVTGFDQLRFIQASEQLIEDSHKRLSKEEERVNKAIKNGLAIPFDRDKIKLARLELESQSTELKESKALLFQKLTWQTGIDQATLEQISYELSPLLLPEELTVNDKQELEALEAYKKAGEFVLKKEKGSFLPQAGAFAGVSYNNLFNGQSDFHLPNLPASLSQPQVKINELKIAPNWMAGVMLKWELFGGTERKHKIQQAKINIEQLDNKLDDSKDQLSLLLTQKLTQYHTRLKQIKLVDQQVVIAEHALSLSNKQYQQGLISITQRLESENDFVKAEQHRSKALVDQRKAALEALATTGKFSEKIQYQ